MVRELTTIRRLVISAIGLHSLLLGSLLLFWPIPFCERFGFDLGGTSFYPSQSGIFLVILGLCYLRVLVEPALESVIVISKSLAVVFLIVWAVRGAQPILWAAAVGDAAMLAAVLLVRPRHATDLTRRAAPASHGADSEP